MAIEWTKELATGLPVIDEQHRELFRRINTLLDACQHGRGKDEITRVIIFLEDYVVTHFSAEELQMLKSGYPTYASHKALHDEFRLNFAALRRLFEADGPAVHVIIKTNQVVVEWLTAHIKRVDKAFGEYLQANPDSAGGSASRS